MIYPSIGFPPFNCDMCGGRVRGDFCHRHPIARMEMVRLIDKFMGMRVLRYVVPAAVSNHDLTAKE